ncbi:MAG: aminotransferase class V-fold PLP-dependent enzyme [Clostridia bacterium]|nr:aminotransferase class V-fold PLP-dependent enzyme [Clostridia bacterium]
MPGHGGVGEDASFFASAAYDLTELEGLDNLLSPNSVIAEAEALAAAAYGSADALMLTQGATCGIHIAVLCVGKLGKAVCIGDMHKSFWHAAMLYDLETVRCDTDGLRARLEVGDIGSVFITSPDYFGNVADLRYIKKLCKDCGVALVVDAAHGAHFAFSEILPDNPAAYADIAVFSQHKTMCTYGGGALMCVSDAFSAMARVNRQLVHSTSPSYLIAASIDFSRALWSERGEEFYLDIAKDVKIFSASLPAPYRHVPSDDISRVIIDCGGDAYSVMRALEHKGIYCEAAIGEKLICIVTPYNRSVLKELALALGDIPPQPLCKRERLDLVNEGVSGRVRIVSVDECVGKRACMPIGLYPPGTPEIFAGDVLDERAVKFIKDNIDRVFGLASGGVVVVE